ncbi:cholesterol 25-hydroxylase-like protein [Trichomycterus rosablanca]|uniref:cholesterol 25-hydroxylase-like protein n=1 Tax=Trichomycterus rosablanca TaxID=2290929 RepID=UPI002F35261E
MPVSKQPFTFSQIQSYRMFQLQDIWDTIRQYETWLRSPLFPVLFSLTIYISFCLPFVILDLLSPRVPLVRKYKIQQKSDVSLKKMWNCLALSLYNHVVYLFPLSLLLWYWRPVIYPAESPRFLEIIQHLVACLLLFDFQYFVWHVLHHKVPWLYRTFHKVHHNYTSTFALTTEYSGANVSWIHA